MERRRTFGSVALAVAALACAAGTVAAAVSAAPVTSVAIFYYAWYGTPARDGAWQHWQQGGTTPPARLGSNFYPARGPYSSTDPAVLGAHMTEIRALGVDSVIVSWWGPGSVEDVRLPLVARAAGRAGLGVAVHVEPWPGRTPAAVAATVPALAALGVRDLYVYASALSPDTEWAFALEPVTSVRIFANTWLPRKAVRGGFDGLYPYDVVVYPPESFARVCNAARKLGLACAPSVGPGFDARVATSLVTVSDRREGRRYDHAWSAALRARPDVVTITSYNEWHEGTQIEAASVHLGSVSYDGAWGLRGVKAQTAYLDRTAHWIAKLRAAR